MTLSVNGEDVDVDGIDGGRFSFRTEFTLPPGQHAVEVVATDQDSLVTTVPVLVIVDSDLQLEFAFVTRLDVPGATIEADYAEWLTGEEATLAARADGAIGPDEELFNDFYIRNRNQLIRTLPLAEGLMPVLYACYVDGPCVTQRPVDLHTWSALLVDPETAQPQLGWTWYGGGFLPYWLTLKDQVVVQVGEQYLP